ncbi:MAG: site-specific DNA-methyltransferase [Burkholderiales bacterium]|nr:MAG: site-specific DNA-methyltransferase [Burkholderiales bacterium]
MLNRAHFGDCRDIMRTLAAEGVRVQCCVTSPPYYSLRDYGHPGQIGLEQTPAEYVAALVEVFEGVRELLASNGVLWLNLGDSYASGGRATRDTDEKLSARGMDTRPADGARPKNLLGIPWRVAFALQEAGWYVRQDIIWHKPNPMPESVGDRCTKAHEYLFLMSKSERYFWDATAMQERSAAANAHDHTGGFIAGQVPGARPQSGTRKSGNKERKPASVPWEGFTRNRRSVWTVSSEPYSGAHSATFPRALIEPCILAGSRPGDVVFDPFLGSGTTAQVAQELGRQWVGCEINREYEALIQARVAQLALPLCEVAREEQIEQPCEMLF